MCSVMVYWEPSGFNGLKVLHYFLHNTNHELMYKSESAGEVGFARVLFYENDVVSFL